MSVQLKSGSTSDTATVDTDKQLLVNLPKDPNKAGNVRILDADGNPIDTTENNYLRVSTVALSLYDQIEGSAVNTNLWNPFDVTTQTVTQAGGFININAGLSTAINTSANLKSQKVIPLYGSLPFLLELTARVINLPEANGVGEFGLGTVSGGSAPTDGAYFRWDAAGGFYCIINNGGTETRSANLAGTTAADTNGTTITLPPSVNTIHLYALEVVEDHVQFFVDDIKVADINTPSGQAYPFNNGRQQIFARTYIGGTSPSLAPQIQIGQVTAKYEDLQQTRQWGEFLSSIGRGAYQSPLTPFGQSANHTNSTSPTSATLSNTAAGYTTFGGRFQFAALAGAATDYALFGFQVPAGYQLFLNTVSISIANTGVAGSITVPTLLEWALGLNASAVSLATADGTNTWAPRRIPLGMQAFGLTAALGSMPSDLTRRFDTPLVIDSGRFLHVIVQIPVGAATASQIFRGTVMLNGFLE